MVPDPASIHLHRSLLEGLHSPVNLVVGLAGQISWFHGKGKQILVQLKNELPPGDSTKFYTKLHKTCRNQKKNPFTQILQVIT